MFSTAPMTRIPVFCAICAARTATCCAAGCGVVTTSASARGRSCPSDIATSPVPGWHVHEQRVELAPVHVREELLERLVQHRAAPHDRRVLLEEEADRHELEVAANRRDDHLVDRDRLLVDAEHVRDRVAVDVAVENADLLAERRQRVGEIRRERRLADATLAGRDGDDARARGERDRPVGGVTAAEARDERGLLLRRHHVEAETHPRDAGNLADVARDLLLEGVAQRAARRP